MTDSRRADYWAKVERRGERECWPWRGKTSATGRSGKYVYGVWHNQGSWKAHRIAYLLETGTLDAELTIDHCCNNKLCVNPGHLMPVKLRENVRRMLWEKYHPLPPQYPCGHDRVAGKRACPPCQVKKVAASQAKRPEYYREMKRRNKQAERARKKAAADERMLESAHE